MIPDWARAHGEPVCAAVIRSSPRDFVVDEILGFEPDGDGEHDFLIIRKTAANTAWVARQLARHAGVPARDVGYCGLKDRHAITTQAFTVRRPNRDGTNWSDFAAEGTDIVSATRHNRKLRRGSHAANRFEIRLRGDDFAANVGGLRERLARVASAGVPNYFGEQRFGRDGQNIGLAKDVFAGKRVKRDTRSIAISAARSLLFNRIVDARVRNGSWNRILPGELANLDGSGSVFAVEDIDEAIQTRCEMLDIHPTGSLWGKGAPLAAGHPRALEIEIAGESAELADGLKRVGVDASSRALRVCVADAEIVDDAAGVGIRFQLPAGAFATAVLREIVAYPGNGSAPQFSSST